MQFQLSAALNHNTEATPEKMSNRTKLTARQDAIGDGRLRPGAVTWRSGRNASSLIPLSLILAYR